MQTDAIGLTALALVLLAWVIFGLAIVLRRQINKSHSKGDETDAKYGPESKWGIALQSVAFAATWLTPRKNWWALPPSQTAEIAVAVIAVVLAYSSAILCMRAVQTLGKQWAYQARVLKDHDLIKEGPYSIVRNPIYLGMFGMILSTVLVFSHWWLALIAIALFLVGNQIRIRSEEKLLRETFGEKFDDYAARVPAFIPFLR
ncbi:MAG: isoprenylcysteine carboxylmethyltransferase family protein [Acidobacteria bacterium]|nr:isoprenylcysteine carboxylmethyltransferase family protein [Acidobacteriota bacterium]